VIGMKRDKMIQYLIEDFVNMCNCDQNFVEEILYCGWKGIEDWSDKDLREAFENLEPDNFDDENAKIIKVEQKRLAVYNGNKI